MKLHRTSGKPDWANVSSDKMNGWQRLADRSNGLWTPANVITIVGLILVIFGLNQVANKHYVLGLILVAIGRLCDLLDGIVAEATHTKSPFGEFLDVTADKIASLVALLVLAAVHIVPWWVAAVILLANLANVVLTFVAKFRNITIHPSKYGKLFMAFSWTSLLIFVLVAAWSHTLHQLLEILAYVFLAAAVLLELRAFDDYLPKD